MKKLIAFSLFATVFAASTTFAAALPGFKGQSADVHVVVNGTVATLSGHVEDSLERAHAERAAARIEGVDEVRNLITTAK